jgi:uncharacterized protein YbjT (DUF2867 family)
MSGTILVTGATGNVGGTIVNLLNDRGESVKAAVRTKAKAESLSQKGITLVFCDYQQPETFAAACEGVERVFLLLLSLAAPPKKVMALVDIANQSGVRHIVSLSGMSAGYDQSLPAYQVEQHIKQSGMGYTLLRPNWFMQNFHTSLSLRESIQSKRTFTVPTGNAMISYIDIRDIAAVATTALTEEGHNHQEYTLTGGQNLDHTTIAAVLSQAIGETVTFVDQTDEEMRMVLQHEGMPVQGIEIMSKLYQSVRDGRSAVLSPDVSNVLGREPISFQQYARDYAKLWKERGIL